jgi:hypothetical protein
LNFHLSLLSDFCGGKKVFVKQLSVFIENRSGRLAAACDALAENDINIVALSLADTADFGILRMIVNDPETAYGVLREANFTVIQNDVLAVEIEDRPGGLAELLDVLEDAGINVEYMYAFSTVRESRAALVFRFEDNEGAVEALKGADVNVMDRVDVLGE